MNRNQFEASLGNVTPGMAEEIRSYFYAFNHRQRKALGGRYSGAKLRELRAERGVGRPVRNDEFLREGPVA